MSQIKRTIITSDGNTAARIIPKAMVETQPLLSTVTAFDIRWKNRPQLGQDSA